MDFGILLLLSCEITKADESSPHLLQCSWAILLCCEATISGAKVLFGVGRGGEQASKSKNCVFFIELAWWWAVGRAVFFPGIFAENIITQQKESSWWSIKVDRTTKWIPINHCAASNAAALCCSLLCSSAAGSMLHLHYYYILCIYILLLHGTHNKGFGGLCACASVLAYHSAWYYTFTFLIIIIYSSNYTRNSHVYKYYCCSSFLLRSFLRFAYRIVGGYTYVFFF